MQGDRTRTGDGNGPVLVAVRAIVLVDHGSREPAANALLDDVARGLGERVPGATIFTSHMELAAPELGRAIDRAVEEGASEVTVVPYFLAPGRHGKTDIPRLVDAARQQHPEVTIRLTEPLGAHPAVLDALADRIAASEGQAQGSGD